jgi:tetratricopeptide (TPR) repeat protein
VKTAATFVGRNREREELRSALADAVAGRGRLFLLAGEPGIGKTRLADELAGEATSLGAQVAWGRCWESRDAPAYWPWIQVLRSSIRGRDPSTIASYVGSGATAIANLVPEFRAVGFASAGPAEAGSDTSIPSSSTQAPELERFQLFDSITNFFRNFTLDTPLVIILDDVHAADVDSLLLLRFLARDLRSARIMLIGAYRESEVLLESRLTELINDIHREGDRIVLRGLTERDTAEFVERTSGARPDPKTVAALHNATEGNPFFLSETIRLLIGEGRLGSGHAPSIANFKIPSGVRSAIRRRVRLVSEAARETLALASAIGREFDLPTLRQLSPLPEHQLLDALDEAVASGLLGTVGHPAARYRYNHALVSETLYSDLPAITRQSLHLKIAETLERLAPAGEKPHFAQVAHHFVRALPAGSVDKALEYSRRGAEQALAVHAYEEAVRLYRAVLEVLPLQSPPDEQLRFEATLSLGDALNRAGLFNQCRQTFEQAAEIARKLGQPHDLVRAVLGRGMPITDAGVIDRALVALLEEALDAVEEDDSGRRAMLMSRVAHELYWSDESGRATALARHAIDLARRGRDIPTLIYVLHYGYLSLWVPENLEERFAAIEELISLAQETRSNHWILRGRQLRFVSLLETGDIQAAREELAAFRDLTVQLQQQHGILELCEASIALLEGRLDETRRIAEGALAIGESLEGRTGQFRQTFTAIEITLRWQEGRLVELEKTLKDIADRSSDSPFRASDSVAPRVVLALCYCEGGKKEEAAIQFERLAADDFSSIPRKMTWLGCIVLLAEVCAQLNDARRAARLYELLAPYASRNPMLTWHVCFGSAEHYLGRLAATMARSDQAIEHFEAALRFNQQMGARLWIAHNQYYCAETLLVRNRPGDRERADSLLRECLDTASELGIAIVQRKAQAALGLHEHDRPGELGAVPKPSDNEFYREGDIWTIQYKGRMFRLKDIKGMSYIVRLLGNPGVEFHALDLVGAGEIPTPAEDPQTTRAIVLEREDLHVGRSDDSGEMLDAQSKAAYKRRLDDLRGELEDAQEFGDADRAAGIQEEIDAIARELSRAIGLGGRDRRAGSASERARLNVTRAVKAAIDRISRNDPDLAQLLNKSIKTGTFCSYLVDPGATVPWRL